MTLNDWLLIAGLTVNALWLSVALPSPRRCVAFAAAILLVLVQSAWLIKILALDAPPWAIGSWNADLSCLLWHAVVAPVSIVAVLLTSAARGGMALARRGARSTHPA